MSLVLRATKYDVCQALALWPVLHSNIVWVENTDISIFRRHYKIITHLFDQYFNPSRSDLQT